MHRKSLWVLRKTAFQVISLFASTAVIIDISNIYREVGDGQCEHLVASGFMTPRLKIRKCLLKMSMKVKGDWIYKVFQHEQVFRWCAFPPCGFVELRRGEVSECAELWELQEQFHQEQWKFSCFLETSTYKIYFHFSEIQMCSNFLWCVNLKLNIFVTMFIFFWIG